MYERLKRLYQEKKIDETSLMAAVNKGWITKEEAKEIVSQSL